MKKTLIAAIKATLSTLGIIALIFGIVLIINTISKLTLFNLPIFPVLILVLLFGFIWDTLFQEFRKDKKELTVEVKKTRIL